MTDETASNGGAETIAGSGAALRAGTLTAAALAERYLRRVEAGGARLRGFGSLDPGLIRAAAAAADVRRAAGDDGALLGQPIAIKDIIDTQDQPTTYGSVGFRDHRPTEDAFAVRKLREAGTVTFGKANTFEFAMLTLSPLFGGSVNPWNENRLSGGSSNGSATIVAAGLAAAALGTDTAGSIRNPASYCGIVGLKPTHGRVSIAGVSCLAYAMDTVGPMTRSVRDAAIVLAAIAGYDPEDPVCVDTPVPDFVAAVDRPVAGMRIGIPSLPPALVAPEVNAAWRSMAGQLAAIGAVLVDVELPPTAAMLPLWMGLSLPESVSWQQDMGVTSHTDYSPVVQQNLALAANLTGADHVRAVRSQILFRRRMIAAMAAADVLLLPTTPTTAPLVADVAAGKIPCGDESLDIITATTALTMPFNLSGHPAITVPVGLDSDGMPIGLQVVGRHFDEPTMLAVAAAVEQVAAFSAVAPMHPS